MADRLQARKAELRAGFIELLEDSDFAAAISYGTGDPQKVRLRFSRIENLIEKILQ